MTALEHEYRYLIARAEAENDKGRALQLREHALLHDVDVD